jgi:hypothetical protein
MVYYIGLSAKIHWPASLRENRRAFSHPQTMVRGDLVSAVVSGATMSAVMLALQPTSGRHLPKDFAECPSLSAEP